MLPELAHVFDWQALAQSALPVVLPSARGARLLQAALDRAAAPLSEPPELLAWSSWLQRAFDDAGLAGTGPAEWVLGAEQELAVWQRIVSADDQPAAAAALAQEAWRIAHAWRLDWTAAAPYDEDAQAFARWARAYLARTAELGALDFARLPAALPAAPAGTLCAHGFLAPPPAWAAWLAPRAAPALGEPAAFATRQYRDREAELAAALGWAADRARQEPRARVVVALPQLARERVRIARALRDVLGPAPDLAVRLAVPEPLAAVPAIRSALALTTLERTVSWAELSLVILSPHLAGAAEESGARAAFDARWRARGRFEAPLADVVSAATADGRVPLLARVLGGLLAHATEAPRRQSLARWREHFEGALDRAGWPGQAAVERDLRAAWIDAGDRLQQLDTVLGPVSRGEAIARLRDAIESASAPDDGGVADILVVTPEQAAALAPDHLWLAGAEADAFAGGAGPSPFLAHAAQRAAGVPGADGARDLARARLLLGVLARGGGTRIVSCCSGDGDERLVPNPLFPGFAECVPVPTGSPRAIAWTPPAVALEFLSDETGVALPDDGEGLRGGVAALAAQAACPFQGYARHRLRAQALEEPRPGLDARVRGTLVHKVLAWVWSQLHEHAALVALDAAAEASLIDSAITRAFADWQFATALERALAALERERLAALARAWLAFERGRAPFTVRAVEQPASVEFAGLRLHTRIDRLDRLADGGERLVDYKTGDCRASAWAVPRLDEPQLPFYALTSASRTLSAIAYARVDAREPDWIELPAARDDAAAWSLAVAAWQADIGALVAELRAGHAAVSPKRGAQTCRHCDLALLCRIGERAGAADDQEGDA